MLNNTHRADPPVASFLPRPVRRIVMIHNPSAGQRKSGRFRATVDALRAAGVAVDVAETGHRGHATEIASAITPEDADIVAAAGGDGTINEVIGGLRADAPPLAIVPLGTANVLAHEIGLVPDPGPVTDAMLHGRLMDIHLGEAGGRRFVMMAGAGFDARVVRSVDPALKRLVGKGAYVVESVKQLIARPLPRLAVTVDGTAFAASSVIVANGRHYGGGFVAAPRARLDAPSLEVCLLTGSRRFGVVRSALALAMGRFATLPDLRIVTAREVTIDGPADEPVQFDGDLVGTLPMTIRVSPVSLRLMVPAATAAPSARSSIRR